MKNYFYFTLLLMLISCYKEDDYSLSLVDYESVKTSFSASQLEADGTSSTYFIIEVPDKIKKEYPKVNVKISNGKFDNDKQEIDAPISNALINGIDKKIAKVKIFSSQKVEDALIEIKIGDFYKTNTLKLIRAYPNIIKTDIPSLTISYGYQTINLTTKLTRPQGKPSLLSKAKIKAITIDGTEIGSFMNYNENVNENGVLSNQFSLGTTNCNCAKVYIVSETHDTDTTVIKDTISLIIN